MIRLLVLGLVFTLWSLTASAPVNNTAAPHKGTVFPKKGGKTEEQTTLNPTDQTAVSSGDIKSTEPISESTITSSLTPTYVPVTVDEQWKTDISTEREEEPLVQMIPEESDRAPEETSPQEPEYSSDPVPHAPLPPDANDGLIEYNLGNPLALKLHLPWWPLKDMLRSIQDAISVMNLTMTGEMSEADNTKTKIVQFDDRNYTLKVRVFKPHENNRLLVRLISLTPVIEEGKIPTEKGTKTEDEKKNEALEDSSKKPFPQMKKKDDEKEDDEKEDEEKRDDDDDGDDKKEGKKKTKDSKKEKPSKKKKEEKKGSDSEKDSD